jgi:hypothetical protein
MMISDEEPVDLRIKVVNISGQLHTDVLVTYKGEHYYSRYNWVIHDTPINRANERALFLRRLKL